VRRKWTAYRRRPRRSERGDPELRQLVLRLARENPRWGLPKDPGQAAQARLRDLPHRHRQDPPWPTRPARSSPGPRYLARVRPPAPERNAGHRIITVETVWLTRLYVLFFQGRTIELAGLLPPFTSTRGAEFAAHRYRPVWPRESSSSRSWARHQRIVFLRGQQTTMPKVDWAASIACE